MEETEQGYAEGWMKTVWNRASFVKLRTIGALDQ